jgi:opacity protein-like surface antigen
MRAKKILLGTTAIFLAASGLGAANAADLMVKAPPPAPAVYKPFYIEAEVGGGFFNLTNADPGIIYGCASDNGPFCSPGEAYGAKIWGGGGPVVGGRLGWQFNPMFRADVSVNVMAFTAAGKISEIDGSCGTRGSCGLNNTKSAISIVTLLNGYIELGGILGSNAGHWHPYVTGGVGFAHNKVGANCISCDYGAENEAGTTDHFAWAVGAGARIDIFQDFKMDIAYRYYDLGSFQSGLNGTQSPNPDDVNGRDSFKAGAHTVVVGLVYPF